MSSLNQKYLMETNTSKKKTIKSQRVSSRIRSPAKLEKPRKGSLGPISPMA